MLDGPKQVRLLESQQISFWCVWASHEKVFAIYQSLLATLGLSGLKHLQCSFYSDWDQLQRDSAAVSCQLPFTLSVRHSFWGRTSPCFWSDSLVQCACHQSSCLLTQIDFECQNCSPQASHPRMKLSIWAYSIGSKVCSSWDEPNPCCWSMLFSFA